MNRDTIKSLESRLLESIRTSVVPMGSRVDPDTFSGPAPIEMPSAKGGCGCSCKSCQGCKSKVEGQGGDCGCGCAPIMSDANTKPVNKYTFTREVENGSDPLLPLGYTYTKFLSLLQSMVAPLPVSNEPGRISVIASPALARGLSTLANKEGMTLTVAPHKANEGHCS